MCTWEDISGCSGTSQEGIKYAHVWDYQLKIEDSKMRFPHVVEAVQTQVFITVSTSRGIPYMFQQFQVVRERICSAAGDIISVQKSSSLGSMSINSLSLKKEVERKVWNIDSATLNLQWFWHAPCSLKTINLLLSETISFWNSCKHLAFYRGAYLKQSIAICIILLGMLFPIPFF